MMCPCHEPGVFGHRTDCPLRPGAQSSCGSSCTNVVCWDRCRAWRAQAQAFGWQAPDAGKTPENALT